MLQYRTVSVPHVGTFRIVQQPAQLDVADKRILPPAFAAELSTGGDVPDHQLDYLNAALGNGRDAVSKELSFLGDKIHEHINGAGYDWEGLGRITRSTQSLPLRIAGLEAVAAEKVIRQHAQHNILVGDKEMRSGEMPERLTAIGTDDERQKLLNVIGWILLALAIMVIAYFLYAGKFNTNAAGSKLHPMSVVVPSSPYSFL